MQVFHVPDNSSPKRLRVSDGKGTHDCARALYKNETQDFRLGSSLTIAKWWDGHPLHLTIVPFNSAHGGCGSPSNADFDAARALAVWLSPYAGQSDPNHGSVYCDVSKVSQGRMYLSRMVFSLCLGTHR